MTYPYAIYDVFTQTPFAGNPLAVVFDAQGLSDEAMQAIACEFNLSETVFVLPPETAWHSARIRIFTPAHELPFAGHPTVGTAVALMERMQDGYGEHGNLFEHDFLVCDRYQGAPEAVAKVTAAGIRAEMILGAKDAMTPPKAAKPLAEMSGARVQTLPAGHSLMTEAPEGMLNALKAALD